MGDVLAAPWALPDLASQPESPLCAVGRSGSAWWRGEKRAPGQAHGTTLPTCGAWDRVGTALPPAVMTLPYSMEPWELALCPRQGLPTPHLSPHQADNLSAPCWPRLDLLTPKSQQGQPGTGPGLTSQTVGHIREGGSAVASFLGWLMGSREPLMGKGAGQTGGSHEHGGCPHPCPAPCCTLILSPVTKVRAAGELGHLLQGPAQRRPETPSPQKCPHPANGGPPAARGWSGERAAHTERGLLRRAVALPLTSLW